MNIELQATDSSGSSSYDEEAEDDYSSPKKNHEKAKMPSATTIVRDALGEDPENPSIHPSITPQSSSIPFLLDAAFGDFHNNHHVG
jgi:hypothetical protein